MFLVFWALILWNLQPSDGVVRDGEYGSFHDHYGDNLEGLTPGDVLEKENTGGLVLIYDRDQYFQMHTGKIEENQREIECHLYNYPKKGQLMRRLKKVRRVPYYYPTIALVDKLLMKRLPFHWNYCNKYNYMNYILYGQLTRNAEHFKECPLAASWVGLRERAIRRWNFKLKDSNGIEHDFSEYRFSNPQRAESSQQGRKSGSSKRLEKSDSLLRASSLERMVQKPFQSTSKKRGRSV